MAFACQRGLPVQQILYLDLAAACVGFAIPGGLIVAGVSAPVVVVFEKLRADFLNLPYAWKLVVFQTALEVMMALIVGWLVTLRQVLTNLIDNAVKYSPEGCRSR